MLRLTALTVLGTVTTAAAQMAHMSDGIRLLGLTRPNSDSFVSGMAATYWSRPLAQGSRGMLCWQDRTES
jgi:hypothetical protein